MTLTEMARSLVGGKGLTMQAFADLTGVSLSTVARRTYGKSEVPETARNLYRLIMDLSRVGLSVETLDVLESIPESERDEGRALSSLIRFAMDKGHSVLVRQAVRGEGEEDDVIAVDETTEDVVRHMKALARAWMKKARIASKGDPELARHYEEMASQQSLIALRAESILEDERSKAKASQPDDEPPDEEEP